MADRAHLRAVDAHTGEVETPESLRADLRRKEAMIKGLERDLNGWRVRYRQLAQDKEQEARESPLWPVVEALFRAWRKRCNHPRSPFTPDRFWVAEPFLSSGKYGPTLEARVKLCATAIAGAGFDAFEVKRKNGTTKRFDDWSTQIFKDSGRYEDFCCRAPRGWEPTLSEPLLEAVELAEKRMAKLKEAAAA